jgi:hypothetical protein
MSASKQILPEDWIDYTDTFTSGNRGRKTSIEVYENGKETIAHDMLFHSMVYDPPGKGDALSIALGSTGAELSHVISSPSEIREVNNNTGQVISLEITDRKNVQTLVLFSAG